MKQIFRVKKISIVLALLFSILAAILLLCYPQAASSGAQNGIGYCVNILIPSLFPFMVLSTFFVKSGLSDMIGKVLNRPFRFLFHLPGCAAASVLMSLFGGYPVGARGIAALRENGSISEEEAERMLNFCVNAGPAFVISAVGASLLGNLQIGIILFTSQIIAAIILGIFSGIAARKETVTPPLKSDLSFSGNALIYSAADAARGMMSMCTFVILFAALLSLLRESGAASAFCTALLRCGVPAQLAAPMLSVLLEVTGGCYDTILIGGGLPFLAFAIGWGGLCVHFQIFSSVSKIRFSKIRFLLFRLLHGLLSAAFCQILLLIFPNEDTADVFFSTTEPLSGTLSGSIPAAIALVVLCAALLLSIRQKKAGNKVSSVLK